jgi:nitrite reductase (NO-forming)
MAGLAVALVAGALANAALLSSADNLVSETVDERLNASGTGAGTADIVPALTPKAELAPVPEDEVNVSFAPEVPPRANRSTQAIVEVEFEIVEGVQAIDPAGVQYETWGFTIPGAEQAGPVAGTPGPMIRARVGDLLRLTLTNPATATHPHNIDLHSVTGQGGGAEATTVAPGESKTIEARLLYPGLFMYHCAYDDVPLHIAHGMSGGILVDPETPLADVEREWYVVQSEYYTTGGAGAVDTDRDAITNEDPDFVVFNGAREALAGDRALQMEVGERARIYFVNGGLNLTSAFHPIGSHWDRVYQEAALVDPPLRGSQTTLVPPGGATVAELVARVPMTIILVDHALSRAFDKGAIGQIVVEGEEDPEIFVGEAEEAAGGHGTDTTTEGAAESGEGGEDAAAAESVATVSMPMGAGDVAPTDAPDEFAEVESRVDYSINVLRVKVGDTVTFVNDDSVMHTVTAVDGSFDSGFMEAGDTWTFTFEQPGDFEYYCLPHPWMRARVIVEP